MTPSLPSAFAQNFLGNAPDWYKRSIVGFLLLNPLVFYLGGTHGPAIAGWLLLVEFIFTLVMALKCYPLQPGGLLVIEAIAIGLASAESVYAETVRAFPVILLLIFMVAGIYFLRELLLFSFTKILLGIRSRVGLSLMMCMTTALLSAFLDALTVVAVVITVGAGFYAVFHRFATGEEAADGVEPELYRGDLDAFRAFLRGLMMHASVGTALGGVTTMVGEPQNLLIAEQAGWNFEDFFHFVSPVSMPVLAVGLLTCVCVEKFRWFGYGTALPASVRQVLEEHDRRASAARTARDRAVLIVQAVAAILLVCALALHVAEVGLIGLLIIVLTTAFNGITDEHRLGRAFEAALPFTALLVVFFAVVAVLHDQHLFEPLISLALAHEGKTQVALFYIANGLLSAISDNVFVATIYITEVKAALLQGVITPAQFNDLAVAINTGTNIPSVATPNGQAAFLFLLTSALAPLIRLSYGRMCWMALPYTVSMSLTGLLAVIFLL